MNINLFVSYQGTDHHDKPGLSVRIYRDDSDFPTDPRFLSLEIAEDRPTCLRTNLGEEVEITPAAIAEALREFVEDLLPIQPEEAQSDVH